MISYVDQINRRDAFLAAIDVATQWKNIGALLGIPERILSTIDHDEERNGAVSCLRVMLTVWLQRTDPPPSWSELADAVEPFDPSKASELKSRFCRFLN
jgi:hypothetical protein